MDTLLVGAIIEARSCERFAALAPELDDELADFYASLLKSESRHFTDYLKLAEELGSNEEVASASAGTAAAGAGAYRVADAEFRFHSGVPGA